ncbi:MULTISPECIES: winged helix-turn-helix domain-containing protein [unclassified Pyrobaculum]|jgi:predicted transcriptional regulator|uniref:winged helix-turn-helix domain-containing protein n=1 Tax=unclassified Pyrobaculum TaxID=2643434 RepID=UPI0021D9C341|nr:winged helix-turn-helix domain-containing protein [Pyrobaculum sp. 3827-6]MCU7788821.1 winged helix-turn-helix domain-containing protein [Pyrobaculum sp. 3827-6]
MGNVDVDIVVRLLSLLLERPMRKTELWRLSKLNYYSFEKYLQLLKEKGLVAERDGFYHLTEKGTRETLAILEWLRRVLYF